MKLSSKLFASYLFVVAVALLVLTIAMALVAPVNFSQQMMHMRGGTSGMMAQRMTELDAELAIGFQAAVSSALMIAGSVAILTALGVSWFVSQRIISPIRSLVALSQRIADGHYEQRLRIDSGDELAELVQSFNRMTESLANTESMRMQLLGDVTHELKTPLTSIKGYMEGLQDGVIEPTPETFQRIHREADRLQRLVQDLQQLSRAEAGRIVIDVQSHSVEEIVLPVVDHLRPQFAEKNITLRVDLPKNLPAVHADSDRSAQVLTNLLGNALQYTPAGGEVHVTATQVGDHVCFTVTDTGIGLSEADRKQIFQRFYRVDKSRARASGGSGIGLTVAKHFVELQGGEIQATSGGVGMGSKFSFTLPAA